MEIGAFMFVTDYSMGPAELARLLEERGFESMWVPEHTHIPASRRSPWPGGADLPQEYWHSYDPFVALSAAAAVTTNLKLGTGICLVVERDPITTAKEIASLDLLSNGRFMFGIGGGWNAEEMENHGTAYRSRWRLLRERILAMKAIWTEDEAEFHGEFVNFDKVWAYPKPVQKPHPPIFMGGDGATTFNRVVEFCDGWMPIAGRPGQEGSLAEKSPAPPPSGRGRSRPANLPVSVYWMGRPRDDTVERMTEAGVDRLIFGLPSAQRDEVMPRIDQCAELIP